MLIEKLISILTPYDCLVCGVEKDLVCGECLPQIIDPKASTCFKCNRLTQDFKTCHVCRRKTKLRRVWVASKYGGYAKALIRKLKFEYARSAAEPLAKIISDQIISDQYDVITFVPTATSRIRKRGYNHSLLLAKRVANMLEIPCVPMIGRLGQARQVGAKRKERLNQLKDAFYPLAENKIKDKRILLIDDVLTTGATLHYCAETLKEAGARSIEAAVVAKN